MKCGPNYLLARDLSFLSMFFSFVLLYKIFCGIKNLKQSLIFFKLNMDYTMMDANYLGRFHFFYNLIPTNLPMAVDSCCNSKVWVSLSHYISSAVTSFGFSFILTITMKTNCQGNGEGCHLRNNTAKVTIKTNCYQVELFGRRETFYVCVSNFFSLCTLSATLAQCTL